MSEVHFYHLGRQALEVVLPNLLQRSRERGWRALVKVAGAERLEALDDHLWSFSDESFLAHGTAREPDAAEQPVLLTLDDDNPNRSDILFLAGGAALPADVSGFVRVVLLLDGRDPDAVEAARATWRRVREAGHATVYWQQDESGAWRQRG